MEATFKHKFTSDTDRLMLHRAKKTSLESSDPSTKVGAVLVCTNGSAWTGFNGFPHGFIEDDRMNDRETKYGLVVHAEVRALLKAGQNAEGATAYVTHLPCASCMLLLAEARISRIVIPIPTDDYEIRWSESVAKSRMIAAEAGITIDLVN